MVFGTSIWYDPGSLGIVALMSEGLGGCSLNGRASLCEPSRAEPYGQPHQARCWSLGEQSSPFLNAAAPLRFGRSYPNAPRPQEDMAILRLCRYSGRGSRKAQRFDATALCRPGREWATANSETPEVHERAVGMRDSVVHKARSACVQGSQLLRGRRVSEMGHILMCRDGQE